MFMITHFRVINFGYLCSLVSFILSQFSSEYFVCNLPFRAEQEDVMELFSPLGGVKLFFTFRTRYRTQKRFAFVEMADEVLKLQQLNLFKVLSSWAVL